MMPQDDNTVTPAYRICFLHGFESGPFGSKYQTLVEHFDGLVTSIDFRNMDLDARLEKAERLTRDCTDLLLVGSSFGGLVAVLLYDKYPERFKGYLLLAPALHKLPYPIKKVPPPALVKVIHSPADDLVPIQSVKDFCTEHHLELIQVDDDHRLSLSHSEIVAQVLKLLA